LLSYKALNACIGGASVASFAAEAYEAEMRTHTTTKINILRHIEIMGLSPL